MLKRLCGHLAVRCKPDSRVQQQRRFCVATIAQRMNAMRTARLYAASVTLLQFLPREKAAARTRCFFAKLGAQKRRANSTRNMACSGSAAVAYRGAGENVGPRTGTCKSRGGGGVRGLILSLTVADASSSRSGVRAGGYSSYTQCAVHALRIPAVPLCHPASQPLW